MNQKLDNKYDGIFWGGYMTMLATRRTNGIRFLTYYNLNRNIGLWLLSSWCYFPPKQYSEQCWVSDAVISGDNLVHKIYTGCSGGGAALVDGGRISNFGGVCAAFSSSGSAVTFCMSSISSLICSYRSPSPLPPSPIFTFWLNIMEIWNTEKKPS